MAIQATWQSHAGPRGAYAAGGDTCAHYLLIYCIHTIYLMGIQPSVFRNGIRPLKSPLIINAIGVLICFRVGISPTHSFNVQVTWLTKKRRIGMTCDRDASIICSADHRINHGARA